LDKISQEKRSWVMSRIKSKDTTPEVILRKKLWASGLRYRKDVKTLPGRPDIVFLKAKVIIFVDGAFWHGKKLSKERLSKMSGYWQEKIQNNIKRDKNNNRLLRKMGFKVIRVTDVQVIHNTGQVVSDIKSILSEQNSC
jgi:DNA mismatch endonuclease, patch repair protein